MDSTATTRLSELLDGAPDTHVFVDLDLHREPLTVTYEPQD